MALTKIINDENKEYRPVLTDKLVLDAKPTVNSFNAITSDAVARAVAGASGEVPAVEEGDNGRVLTAIYDEGGAAVEWADAPTELPDMTDNAGKILGAVDVEGTMEAKWINPPEELPGLTDNAGKVLKVNAGATGVEWANENTVTVDQSYNASSTNPQSGTAVADALSGVNQVPSVGSGNDGMVLKATYRGGEGSYSWYADDNTTYTAGNGIDIDGWNQISVDVDNTTIKNAVSQSTLQTVYSLGVEVSTVYAAFVTNSSVKSKLTTDSSAYGKKIKIHIPGNTFRYQGSMDPSYNVYVELCSNQYFNPSETALYPRAALATTYNSQTGYTFIDEQDIEVSCDMTDWRGARLDPATSSSAYWFMGFFRTTNPNYTSNDAFGKSSSSLSGNPVIISEDVATNTLCVANPIPAFSSDENGKVLGVVNGALAWVSLT